MALLKCPECGSEVSDRAEYCPSCGYPTNNPKTCPECGHTLDGTETECPECGFPISSLPEETVSDPTLTKEGLESGSGESDHKGNGKKRLPTTGIAAAIATILLLGGFFLLRNNRKNWVSGWWESPERFYFFGEEKHVHYYIDKNSVSKFETYLKETAQRPQEKRSESLPLDISVDRKSKSLSVTAGTLKKVAAAPEYLKGWDDFGEPQPTCPSWVIGDWMFAMEGGSSIMKITDEKVYSTPALSDYYEDDFVSKGKYTYKSNGTYGYLSYGDCPIVLNFKDRLPVYYGSQGVAISDLQVKSGTRRAAAKEWLQGRWRLDLGQAGYTYLIFTPKKATMYMPLTSRTIDDSGPYSIVGDKIIINFHAAGKVTLPIDIYNKKLYSAKHQEFEKVSASTKDDDLISNSDRAGRSSGKSSGRRSSSGTRFSSAGDAYDYLFSNRFRNRSNTITLEFTQQGLFINGSCFSGAPQVVSSSSSEALVKVNMVIGSARYFKVNPVEGYIYDTSEGIYYYRRR